MVSWARGVLIGLVLRRLRQLSCRRVLLLAEISQHVVLLGAEQELMLVAVDAFYTYPNALGDEFEFDYAPLAIDSVEGDCPLIENVACAPIQPGALVVSLAGGPFTIAEGNEFGISANDEAYYVVVEQCHAPVDDCPDYPGGVYEFNIMAIDPSRLVH